MGVWFEGLRLVHETDRKPEFVLKALVRVGDRRSAFCAKETRNTRRFAEVLEHSFGETDLLPLIADPDRQWAAQCLSAIVIVVVGYLKRLPMTLARTEPQKQEPWATRAASEERPIFAPSTINCSKLRSPAPKQTQTRNVPLPWRIPFFLFGAVKRGSQARTVR